MINQGFYSATPTKLNLNGPYLSFTTLPSGISGDPGATVNLVGVATASFLGAGATTINDGNVAYRWYEVGVGALSDGNRLSGTNTNTLKISNLQSPGDSNRRFYLEAKYNSTAYENRSGGKNGNHITPANSDPAAASVTIPPATASITASSTSIAYNGSVTITWNTTNADTVTSNFGSIPKNGSQTFSNQTSSRTFSITATNSAGSVTRSVSVSVASPITPSISLSASPSSISYNGSTTLTWSSTNAASVVSSNFGATDVNGSITLTNQTQSKTFSITVRSVDGVERTATTTLSVAAQIIPTITLSASPSSILSGQSTTLTWSSTNAASVVSSNFGATSTSGSTTLTNQTQSKNFTITVRSSDGTQRTANAGLVVDSTPIPTATISASPSSIDYAGSTTVTWNTTDATSITSNFGTTASSGSQVFTNLTSDQTYTITASNSAGSATANANVAVGDPSLPTLNLSASSTSIENGGSTTLTWSTSNATSLSSNFGVTSLSGSTTLTGLVETKTFTATATGPGGSIPKSVTVNVAAALPVIVINSQLSSVSATFNKCTGGGGSVNFSVGASVNNPTGATLQYQWYLNGSALSNGTNISGAQSSTLTLKVLESQSGNNTVYVRVSYSGATTVESNTANYSVTVTEPRPSLSITSQPTSKTVFVGETATFSVGASISDGRPVSYQWYLNNNPISGATSSSYSITPVQSSAGSNSGTYFVIVYDSRTTCTSVPSAIQSNSVTLTVNAPQKIIRVAGRNGGTTSLSYQDVNLSTFTFGSSGDFEVYSPFEDLQVDVKIEAGAGANKGSFSGGRGGQSIVRFTLRRNTEYIIRRVGSTSTGGGEAIFIYEQARLIACVGGGGGAGANGNGGAGGGVGSSGGSGSGAGAGAGGTKGAALPGYFSGGSKYPTGDTSSIFGGLVSSCTIGGTWWETRFAPCSAYGNSALDGNGNPISGSALILRGFKEGLAHRNNGGNAQTSNEGGGGNGCEGGTAGQSGSRAGGGGGNGYNGGVSVIANRTGGRTATNAQFTIALPGLLTL